MLIFSFIIGSWLLVGHIQVIAFSFDNASPIRSLQNASSAAVSAAASEPEKSRFTQPYFQKTRLRSTTKRSSVLPWTRNSGYNMRSNASYADFYHRTYDFDDDQDHKDQSGKGGYRAASPSAGSTTYPGLRKLDYDPSPSSLTSKKDRDLARLYSIYSSKKNKKYFLDEFDDYVGSESDRYHDMSDKYHHDVSRKYIHEHEGFFFPIPVPSHHEKDDNLLPLLLLLLLPLLLFAIIIPLNANLLSTLFLIMQNNGAANAINLAGGVPAVGRRKRHVLGGPNHPSLDGPILEAMRLLDAALELYSKSV